MMVTITIRITAMVPLMSMSSLLSSGERIKPRKRLSPPRVGIDKSKIFGIMLERKREKE
jgi:hypothetical protein